MTVERVRSYAVKTAKELGRAGHPPEGLTVEIASSRLGEQRVGLFRRLFARTVADTVQTRIEGWCLWSQAMTVTEVHQATTPVGQGWTTSRQIWLAADDGRLLDVGLRTGAWNFQSEGQPDRVLSICNAEDAVIQLADRAYFDFPRPPYVPRTHKGSRFKPGYYESNVGQRNAPPLPEGMRISRALTELRKKAGTYSKPPAR